MFCDVIVKFYLCVLNYTSMNIAKKERDKAILNVFFDTMSESKSDTGYVSVEELITRASKKKAPKFFVSPSRAARLISLMHRGKEIPIKNEKKIAMYKEIYRRLKIRCKGEEIDYRLIEDVVNEEATEFYIDKETFKRRIYTANKK